MNAKKIINGIELDESVVDPTDVEMLEDLIMAGHQRRLLEGG